MDMDRIEREIQIDAPPQRVWDKLTEFFWVNEHGEQPAIETGTTFVAKDEKDVEYPTVIETSEPYTYLAYRWASAYPGRTPGSGDSTLVEFTLTEQAGGTRLRVVESGFATLPEHDGRQAFKDNSGGWDWVIEQLQTALA
ncbi:polyketide cyclase [Saccharomonospora sp. CUA-673]|nr:polyketide cyclase [Saccharomonospora sp. CUA-673]